MKQIASRTFKDLPLIDFSVKHWSVFIPPYDSWFNDSLSRRAFEVKFPETKKMSVEGLLEALWGNLNQFVEIDPKVGPVQGYYPHTVLFGNDSIKTWLSFREYERLGKPRKVDLTTALLEYDEIFPLTEQIREAMSQNLPELYVFGYHSISPIEREKFYNIEDIPEKVTDMDLIVPA